MICSGLKDLLKEIQDFKTGLKTDFAMFKEEIKKEMKEKLKKDINQRYTETTKEQATQATKIAGAEERIGEIDSWNMEMKYALLHSLQHQKILQEKRLLKNERPLLTDMDLQIQRAHRALMPKVYSNQPPRSVVGNVLKYTLKKRVFQKAWNKKVQYQN